MITFRSNRLMTLGFVAVFLTTLYIFYPSDHFKSPHTPLDPYGTYEAGGIDSDHWRDPVVPNFEKEVARNDDGVCAEGECKVDTGRKPAAKVAPAKDRMKGNKGLPARLGDEGKKAQAAVKAKVAPVKKPDGVANPAPVVDDATLKGGVIMPKMENATAKAELGRSAWRVLHLMTLRYPETPSTDDRAALKSYFHLFARLYPCGECAQEFQQLLAKYPPQTSSRKTASMWLCSVHNMINERLGKEEFDCLTLNDVYDCGCGPEGEESVKDKAVDGLKKVVDKAAGVKDQVVAGVKGGVNKAEEKIANVKDKAQAGLKEGVKKAGEKAADVNAKVAEGAKKVEEKMEGVADKAGVKEKVKDVLVNQKEKLLPKPNPNAKNPIANRPLGGMNAKEKGKDGLAAAVVPAAAAGGVVGLGEDKKPALEKEEIIYNPKKVAEETEKKVHPEGMADTEEAEEEEEDGVPDEEAEEDEEEEELEEAGDQVVLTELSAEDEEAEEDDSGLLDEEGDEDGDESEDMEVDLSE